MSFLNVILYIFRNIVEIRIMLVFFFEANEISSVMSVFVESSIFVFFCMLIIDPREK